MGARKGIAKFLFGTALVVTGWYFGIGALVVKLCSFYENQRLYWSETTPGIFKHWIKLYCPKATKTKPKDEYVTIPSGSFKAEKQILEEKVDYINDQLESGEITPEQAEQMVVDLCGPIIGKGKAKRIMDIATNPNYSPREVSEKIVDEVPTGLIGPLDKFVKEVGKYYSRKITEDY